MLLIHVMNWDDLTNRFEYTSNVIPCSTVKAKDRTIQEITTQSWQDNFVSDVKTHTDFSNQEITDYTYNWTNSDGYPVQAKRRLLVLKCDLVK